MTFLKYMKIIQKKIMCLIKCLIKVDQVVMMDIMGQLVMFLFSHEKKIGNMVMVFSRKKKRQTPDKEQKQGER